MKPRSLAFLAVCLVSVAAAGAVGVEDLSEEELLAPSPFATKVLTWEDVPEYKELM